MRIAFVSGMSSHPWGGSEVLWSSAAKKLIENGHDVLASVMHWPKSPDQVVELSNMGVQIDRRKFRARTRLDRVMKLLKLKNVRLWGWEPCWHRIVEFCPDLVCVSHGTFACGIEWMYRCNLEGIPYASVAHANAAHWWPQDAQLPVLRESYLSARKAYFVSDANKRLFEMQIGDQLTNAEVVWNPFNVPFSVSPLWPDESLGYRLACVARLEIGAKGQDILCQVMADEKWRRRDITVTLFGKGYCEEGIRRLVEKFELGQKILFGGHVNDIEGTWRNFHALILPSRFEGLPMSLVEATLCGRIGIVTDVAGNSEIVEDNVTGFIASAPTVPSVDEALERAWSDRDKWREMGTAARAKLLKRIPSDPAATFAEKLLELAKGAKL